MVSGTLKFVFLINFVNLQQDAQVDNLSAPEKHSHFLISNSFVQRNIMHLTRQTLRFAVELTTETLLSVVSL